VHAGAFPGHQQFNDAAAVRTPIDIIAKENHRVLAPLVAAQQLGACSLEQVQAPMHIADGVNDIPRLRRASVAQRLERTGSSFFQHDQPRVRSRVRPRSIIPE
jgi:hypothetical protein